MLFDTHAHFGSGEGLTSALEALSRARDVNVERFVVVGGSAELNDGAEALARAGAKGVCIALGLDRSQAEALAGQVDDAVSGVRERIAGCRDAGASVVAIGEIGLDYHYEAETREAQRSLFAAQLELAADLSLPVVVHSREADADTLELLRKHGSSALRAEGRLGVLHCFTGSENFARELLALGMLISFSGIATFSNAASLRECAAVLPLDVLLVETDCPYLAPVPVRGTRNEPANVRWVAACVADARGVSPEAIAAVTTENAGRLFGN